MTLVTIDLGDVAGGHHPDDYVIIRAEAFRESQGGGITSTAEVIIPLVDGVGQAEVEPGPVVVSFRCQAVADTREKRGVVPDSGTVGIERVLEAAFEYLPPVVNHALATIKGAVEAEVEAIKSRRGAVLEENPDTWKAGDKKQGIWDLQNYSRVNAAVAEGYTPPLGNTPHHLQHMDDAEAIGGSYQIATTIEESSRGGRIFLRQKAWNKGFEGWRELAQHGSEKSFDVRGQPLSLSDSNPDTWSGPTYQGMWQVQDTSTINVLLAAGYTPPWGADPHLLQHIESGAGQSVQVAWVLGGKDRVLWRVRLYGATTFGAWSELGSGPLEASRRDRIFAIGDSFTEGGSHGVLWPAADTWVYKLSQLLGIPIINAGKGGARADEIVLKAGRKRTWVKIAGDAIPASGAASVELSWKVEAGGNRWFSQEGTIMGESVFLEQNGTTGAWTIRRKTSGTAVPAPGWVEWLSLHERENSLTPMVINLGKNDLTSNVTGDYATSADHVIAANQQFVDSLPARAQSLVLLGHFPNLDSSESVRLQVEAVNEGLSSLYPRAYFDQLAFMRDLGPSGALARMGVTPTPEDEDLVSRGYPPASCFDAGDGGHPNKDFHTVMAARLAERIRNRGLILPT